MTCSDSLDTAENCRSVDVLDSPEACNRTPSYVMPLSGLMPTPSQYMTSRMNGAGLAKMADWLYSGAKRHVEKADEELKLELELDLEDAVRAPKSSRRVREQGLHELHSQQVQ